MGEDQRKAKAGGDHRGDSRTIRWTAAADEENSSRRHLEGRVIRSPHEKTPWHWWPSTTSKGSLCHRRGGAQDREEGERGRGREREGKGEWREVRGKRGVGR